MRHWTVAAAAALFLLLLPGAATRAEAQCTTGCSSTSSCNGTGKAGCVAECSGSGGCTCKDDKCGTKPLPPPEPAGRTGEFLPASSDGEPAASVWLLVDCRENVLDVLLLDGRGQAFLAPLPEIRLRPPAQPVRIAARE